MKTDQMLTRDILAARLARSAARALPDDRDAAGLAADAPGTPAAVLVPLIPRAGGVTVLLTQRTAHLKHHPGHVSFPGGRVEDSDTGRVQTALRETREEIGLTAEHVEVIGTLPDYMVSSGFRVTPVVGWVEPPFELALDPFEVASAFEVPLSFVLDPANHQHRSYHFGGRHRRYLAMPYQGYYIWGATAGMLYSLYRKLTDEPSS